MNPKNTWLLVMVAAGLFAFIWLIEPRLRPSPPPAPKVMTAFNPDQLTGIQVMPRGQSPIRLERTNGVWLMTKPLVYPVKAAAVDNFVHALQELSPQTRITAGELKKVRDVSKEYGFDTPADITLEFGEETRTLHLGSRTAMGDALYTQLVGMDTVDVINADFLKFVPRRADDWRDPAFVNLTGVDFDRVTVGRGERTFELARDATNKLWRMTKPIAARADNVRIGNLLDNLQNLRVDTFVTDRSNADLEPFGLQPPQLELTFAQGTNRLFSLQFGKSPAGDSTLVYARSNAQSSVVLLPRDLVAGWWAKTDDFRERRLLDLALDPPDLIEIAGEENFYVQQVTNSDWMVFDDQKQSYRADAALMRRFLVNLARLQAVEWEGKPTVQDVAASAFLSDYGLAPHPVRSYILKHTTAPVSANQVDFGFVTNNGCILARRADESSVVAVRTADFTNLPARALELRERRIWYFDASEVTSLTFREKGITRMYDHKKPNVWELADVAGNNGVIDMRQVEVGLEQAAINLGALQVESFVERGDENRAKYGIDESVPRITLAVKSGDAHKNLFLEFGKQASNSDGFYASVPVLDDGQNWTNWIVVIANRDISNLGNWLPQNKRAP